MEGNNMLTQDEIYLFNSGEYYHSYNKMGAHPEAGGMRFTVWAPDVRRVGVTGPFCDWDQGVAMEPMGTSGIWTVLVPGLGFGEQYKYIITTQSGETFYKADPYAFSAERRPGTASVTADIDSYRWKDAAWLRFRSQNSHFRRPMNIYEVHLGSWRRPDSGGLTGDDAPLYSYRELAELLIPYVLEMGYNYIELLPVTEHPFDGSWGYQATGFFAPTSRYGTPEDFMFFVDQCHAAKLGVIMDWVPGHFCRDAHGLGRFNGAMLYEGADHKQWGTYRFNFAKSEVRGFLLSSAMYWLQKYHIDGLRVDGVSSMLYLNFAIEDPAEKRYNSSGGEEDTDAIAFLREFNYMVGTYCPGTFTVAEESSAWPLVSRPPEEGGLGFHYKWDMGWMNDTLKYISEDFLYRKYDHTLLTFSTMYAYSENFILPLSHDEVVHGKRSLIGRMFGSYEDQFAGLRLLTLYQLCHTGAKLNFMGNEFAQFIEWRFYEPLEWFLLDYDSHRSYQNFARAANRMYLDTRPLWEENYHWKGFRWTEADNADQSVLVFRRIAPSNEEEVTIILNFRPVLYERYRVGVPEAGKYREIINTDASVFGGGGHVNPTPIPAEEIPMHGLTHSVELTLPPLGGIVLKKVRPGRQKKYY